ncbi:MAG: pyruvate dehydrogenase (acetyl-transferring) E1 component subunit alpha [Gammaproteobacteria bacterium]|nr:pyruvate dehydrogenase (acetyl-transferring) E1 component subunit alpha [Gammaproteobacteria bacterium]
MAQTRKKPTVDDVVARFDIEYRQILNPQGNLIEALPKNIGNAELIRMYRMMSLMRVFDKKAVNLQRTGKLGTYASCLGHEATHVGIGAAMRAEDCLAPMYREYGAMVWRGVKMEEILLYWGGDERGSAYSGPIHDFPICVPIATQCLHGAGAAMAFQLRREKRCVVTVIGDGGTSEGAFYEALNLAGVRKLPMVFVIANNQWAISVPREIQSAAQTLAQKGIAAGVPAVQVDGNDVITVRDEMNKALQRARDGQGPTVIEAVTYRLSDHTTADDASRYRKQGEVTKAWSVEPLVRLNKYLTEQKVWNEKDEQALLNECAKQVDVAVNAYLDTDKAPPEHMFDYMYEQWPDNLDDQRQTGINYADTNKGGH